MKIRVSKGYLRNIFWHFAQFRKNLFHYTELRSSKYSEFYFMSKKRNRTKVALIWALLCLILLFMIEY